MHPSAKRGDELLGLNCARSIGINPVASTPPMTSSFNISGLVVIFRKHTVQLSMARHSRVQTKVGSKRSKNSRLTPVAVLRDTPATQRRSETERRSAEASSLVVDVEFTGCLLRARQTKTDSCTGTMLFLAPTVTGSSFEMPDKPSMHSLFSAVFSAYWISMIEEVM